MVSYIYWLQYNIQYNIRTDDGFTISIYVSHVKVSLSLMESLSLTVPWL